jgi:hypothetical protein
MYTEKMIEIVNVGLQGGDSLLRKYCDVHAVGQQSTARRLFTAVAMHRNNGSDQHFLCGPFQ